MKYVVATLAATSACLLLYVAAGTYLDNTATVAPSAATESAGHSSTSSRPNIVLIVADDVGIMDVCRYTLRFSATPDKACYYETPNIDQLASHGVVFERAYATPLCTPSRASIMTGRFGPELGFNNAWGFGNYKGSYFKAGLEPPAGYLIHDSIEKSTFRNIFPLVRAASISVLYSDDSQPTLGQYMTEHDKAFIGKWHLGGGNIDGFMPRNHGFHEIAVQDEGFSKYFNWRKSWHAPGNTTAEYLTDDISHQAVNWLQSRPQSEQPFFLLVSHFAVHGPYHAKENDIAYFSEKDTRGNHQHSNPVYASMLKSLDNSVGEIVSALKQLGQLEHTLIIFVSDNGASVVPKNGEPVTSNAPFLAGKSHMYEGGIRVPLIVSWPDVIPAGQVVAQSVDITDLFATLVDAGQYPAARYDQYGDGQSLLRTFELRDGVKRPVYQKAHYFYDPFYRRGYEATRPLMFTAKSAIIDGTDKLIYYHQGYFELFDLAADPYETTDVQEGNSEKVKYLYDKLQRWEAGIPERYRLQQNPNYDESKNTQYPAYIQDPVLLL